MFKNTEKKNNGINPKGKIICIINHHCFKLYVILVCSFLWGFLFFWGDPRNIRNPQNTAFLIKAVNF